MDNTAQLQTYSNDLAKAVASLVQQGGVHQSTIKAEDTQRTEENILSIASKIKKLLCKPSGLLQHLATQVSPPRPTGISTAARQVWKLQC